MNRRKFLFGSVPVVLAAPAVVEALTRKIFLPPRGGWALVNSLPLACDNVETVCERYEYRLYGNAYIYSLEEIAPAKAVEIFERYAVALAGSIQETKTRITAWNT